MKNKYIFKNTDALSFLKELKNNSVDLILTDPPYCISDKSTEKIDIQERYDSQNVKMKQKRIRHTKKVNFGEWDHRAAFTRPYFKKVIQQFYRVLKKGGTCIVFYDFWKMAELKDDLMLFNFKQPRLIEWIKTNPPPLNSSNNYLNNHREMGISVVKGTHPTFNSKYDNGIYKYPSCNGASKARFHPTQKPMKLIGDLIKKHSNENEIILDTFSGSATTLLASLRLNRIPYGCEKDPEFYKRSIQRLNNYLKLK